MSSFPSRPDSPAPAADAKRLQREVDVLRDLFRMYWSDVGFLRERADGKILIFLDAHEIKAYCNPHQPGSLTGFMFDFETMDEKEAASRRSEIRLRHDQIMSGLLFNPAGGCSILPPHIEEMDREVAFQYSNIVSNATLALVNQAKRELKRNEKVARQLIPRFQAQSQGEHTNWHERLVEFFHRHAPALTTILADTLFTPQRRLTAILERSELVLFDDIDWAAFGVSEPVASELRSLEPDPAMVGEIRSRLSSLSYRHNTIEANHVDAAALAHIQLLNRVLEEKGPGNLRVVLVSRAHTLLRAACDIAEKDHSGRLPVRHPRMLALASKEAARLDEAAELTLRSALDVWHDELRLRKPERGNERSLRDTLKDPSREFLDSFDVFERSRLAVDAKWRGSNAKGQESGGGETELARRLVDLFSAEANAEAVLEDFLIQRFSEFGEASSGYLLGDDQLDLPVRVTHDRQMNKLYLTPTTASPIDPPYVEVWSDFSAADGKLPIRTVASKVSEAERPLVWASALAFAGRWRNAKSFAESAYRLGLLHGARGRSITEEALLLRAQIRRLHADPDDLEADEKAPTPEAVLNDATTRDLERVRSAQNEARRLHEEAAQVLEAACRGLVITDLPERIRTLFQALDRSLASVDLDDVRASRIGLCLLLHLYAERHNLFGRRSRSGMGDRAARLHGELRTVLDRLQRDRQADAGSDHARAMELIGYMLVVPPAPARPDGAAPREPGAGAIPEELHLELPGLLREFSTRRDAIGSLIRTELETIAEDLRSFHVKELSLAPVPTPADVQDELAAACPEIDRNHFTIVEAVGDHALHSGFQPEDEAKLREAVLELRKATERAQTLGLPPRTRFCVESAWLYASLLLAKLKPRNARRESFELLIGSYRSVASRFDGAALPWLRISYLAEKTGQPDLEFEAIKQALELVDTDPFFATDPARPHWLQSFVRRRYAANSLKNCDSALRKWSREDGARSAANEVAALKSALQLLLMADEMDTAEEVPLDHRLERVRRTNNIVFYGARMLERPSGRLALEATGAIRSLAQFAERLEQGSAELNDINILHTMGCYYAATAQRSRAQTMAQRMLQLLTAGNNVRGPSPDTDTDEALSEALDWFSGLGSVLRQIDSSPPR